jgi:hypothetical protein
VQIGHSSLLVGSQNTWPAMNSITMQHVSRQRKGGWGTNTHNGGSSRLVPIRTVLANTTQHGTMQAAGSLHGQEHEQSSPATNTLLPNQSPKSNTKAVSQQRLPVLSTRCGAVGWLVGWLVGG